MKNIGGLIALGLMTAPVVAAAADDSEIVVTARRLAPAASELILDTTILDASTLEQSGGQRLDDTLRSVPGFSLFRRQSSRASHPTTQGVTLRGLGPSGAGRTLVMLDGIPQNDPFGGWIDWSRLPVSLLDQVALTRGGGAGAWGNTALAGTIRMTSRIPTGTGAMVDANVNNFGAVDGTATGYAPLGPGRIAITAAGHSGDGPYLIRQDQRGLVDVRTNDRGGLVQGTIAMPLDADTEFTAHGGYSTDQYVNGIAIAKSRVRTVDGSFGVVHDAGADTIGWEAHGYVRDENQPAVFSSVSATRATVTPSLNQFSVPGTAVGGSFIVRVPTTSTLKIDVGADIRRVTGATHEDFTFVGNAFTRVRDAGGSQMIGGGFVEANWQPNTATTISASARVDGWSQDDGHRQEIVLATGAVARDDHYPSRNGAVGDFRLGANVAVAPEVTLRAAGYTGFRVPTLNELYRPFRVGNDITEANPNLKPERLFGAEAGVIWKPRGDVTVDVTAFLSRLRDAVGNVTIRDTPGTDPTLGVVVPVGGVLRQRQNIDRVHAAGVEAELTWVVSPKVEMTARYLYTAPNVASSRAQPTLVGKDLAEVAHHQGVLGVSWYPWQGATLRAEGSVASHQFDDDLNTRRLAGYATLDLYVEQRLTHQATVYINGTNLFDRTIEAGRSADGLVTVGAPRIVTAGVRVRL